MNGGFIFMLALLAMDVGAFIYFLWKGDANSAGIWFGYAVAQLFWARTTL